MIDEQLSQDTIREKLSPVLESFSEEIIPARVELLANNMYQPAYAWMFSFEKQLKYRLEQILRYKLPHSRERILFGPGGALSEGLSNAFVHGHKKDDRKAILLWTCVSRKGLGFAITDSGEGFNWHDIVESYKRGEAFFSIAGNGFSRLFESSEVAASYRQGGRTLCLLYRLR